jgi:hypothetical protein
MKESVVCLIGVGVCGIIGIIALCYGEIDVALAWCTGASWASIASYHARQTQLCRDEVQEAVAIMDDTRKES